MIKNVLMTLLKSRIVFGSALIASTLSLGFIISIHTYTAEVSGAPQGAFMLSGLSGNQLAGEGGLGGNYGGSPSPKPSPTPSTGAHTSNPGGGGTTNTAYHSVSGSYGSNSKPSTGAHTLNPGGGGNTANHDTQQNSRDGVSGGSANNTSDSRDHQDTAASRAAEQQAQQTRETVSYAHELSGFGSGDPSAGAHTAQSVSQKVNDTLSALGQAMSNLMGGTAAPMDTTKSGSITGLDGNQPVYGGAGLNADNLQKVDSPDAPNLGSGAPTDYTKALNTSPTTDVPPSYVTSAATLEAMKTLRAIDTQQMTQAAAFQKKLGNKIDTADSIVSVSEIDKSVGAECMGGCTDAQRIAVANVIMNRIAVKVTSKNNKDVDIHDVLDAIDSNMQRRKTLDNKVYATADVGSPAYAAGAAALNAVLNGNLPADMPDAVRNATNYYNPDTSSPEWAKDNTLGTAYGDHKFLSVDGSTPAQVAAARTKFEAGQINANISFYKGMYNPTSPQAVKIQTEVTRSLTVAGRDIHIVTQSDGKSLQSGSKFQTPTTPSTPDNETTQGALVDNVPSSVPTQKTSLDDPKNSNIPAPADVKHFLVDHGLAQNAVVNGEFAYRLSSAIAAAETATGKKQTNLINSSYRSPEEQAGLYATYIKSDYVFKGVTYHPNPANLGHLAAAPPGGLIIIGQNKGTIAPGSRHQFGAATDLNPGPIRDYIRANTAKFGLETLGLKPDGSIRDEPHIQLDSATYHDPSLGKNAKPLNTNIGPSNTLDPQKSEVAATPPTPANPDTGWSLKGIISGAKQKAADMAKAVTPSEATQKKLEVVSKLPPWAQNIVLSFYAHKGGPPSVTPTTGGHEGAVSSFFPEAQHATTTISSKPTTKVDVTTLPWWQEYQAKLDAVNKSKQQQSI